MMVRKKSKKKSVDSHFAIRCIQRLGYIPNKEDIIRDIQEGRMKLFDRQSNRVTRWLWTCPLTGTECIIPYDKERKQLITILFKNIDYK
jgi:hypothetical protein